LGIDAFQQEVARIALAAAGHGFALAGGNALIAHGIVERLTHDLDLFTSEPGGAGVVAQAVREALEAAGYRVEVLRPPERHGGQFAQMTVSRGDESVGLDLAGDWRQHAPVTLEVGPVLHLEDAVGSKVTAMVGRGLPRDFIDVAAALGHYRREDLMRMAFARDPGLRVVDFSDAVRRLDRFGAEDFADYGLDAAALHELRERFADWPRDPGRDAEGHAIHRAAQEAEKAAGASPAISARSDPPGGR
jgi:hypothetical protein